MLSSISKQCATTRTADESARDDAVKCSRSVEHHTFPMLTMEAQGNLVLPLPVVPEPGVLQHETPAAPGQAPAEAEAVQVPALPVPPIVTKLPPDVEKLPQYKAGQFVDTASFDEPRIPKGYKCEDGRITRSNRTDSKRPASIWPEMWAIMTPKEKIEARQAATPYIAAVKMVRKKYHSKCRACLP